MLISTFQFGKQASILPTIIVDRGEWLGSPANIKGANKDAKIYVGRSMTVHNLLFYAHALCMSYVTNTFLLVGFSVRSKQLLCFCTVKAEKASKNLQQRTLPGFISMPLYQLCYYASLVKNLLSFKLWALEIEKFAGDPKK